MSVIGEAFVAISPESEGFAEKLKAQLTGGGISGIGGLLGVAAVAAVVAGLADVGEQFQKVTHQIQQETGATGQQLTGLFDTVKTVLGQVPASFGDVTTAVDELTKRGVPLGTTLDKLAEQELFLAKITKTDLGTNVEATTALFAKFAIPVANQSAELDVLFKASQQSGKGIGDLITAVGSGASTFKAFGFDLDQSISLVAGLEKAGVNVQPALASLRKAFSTIAKEGQDPQKVLGDITKELRSGVDPTQAMADALKLFGARGGLELATALKEGKFSVDGLIKSITDGKGGIIATGEATLTLGDRVELLKNRALVALQPLGTAVLDAFENGFAAAEPVVEHLASSVEQFASSLLPVIEPLGPAIVDIFKVALPIVDDFATGISIVADNLSHVPAPVVAAAIVLGGLTLVIDSLGGSLADLGAGLVLVGETAIASLGPIGFVIAGVTALGFATHFLSRSTDDGTISTSQLASVFDKTSSSATTLSGRIDDLDSSLSQFLETQLTSGKEAQQGVVALHGFGLSYDDLTTHLNDSQDAFDAWANGLRNNLPATSDTRAAVNKFSEVLDDTRQQLEASAQAAIQHAVATGQLTRAQADLVLSQNKVKGSTDNLDVGATDYLTALKALAPTIDAQTAKQNLNAQATAQASSSYRDLTDSLAAGKITAADAATELGQFGFTADAAKGQITDLGKQISAFNSAVQSGLPGTANAAKQFASDVSTATSQLTSDQAQHTALLQQLSTAGSKASSSLLSNISTNNAAIRKDMATLAADTSPQKFVENLVKEAGQAQTFFNDIKILVAEGFGQLAGQLVQLGPQAAGQLAQGLASDKAKATTANAAAKLLDNTNASLVQFTQSNFAQLNGIGEDIGRTVATGMATGITKSTPIVGEAAIEAAAGARAAINKGFVNFHSDGLVLGTQLGTGLDQGLASTEIKINGTATRMSHGVIHILGSGLEIHSPSEATRRFGIALGDGLVLGLEQSKIKVGNAASVLAKAATKPLTAPEIAVNKAVAHGDITQAQGLLILQQAIIDAVNNTAAAVEKHSVLGNQGAGGLPPSEPILVKKEANVKVDLHKVDVDPWALGQELGWRLS